MVFEFDDRNIMITRMELYSFDDFTFQTIINNNQESNNRIHYYYFGNHSQLNQF